jgi:hypothetical protein
MDKITQILENVVRCKYFEAGVHIKDPIKNSYQDGLGRTTQTLDHVVVVHILIWDKRKSQINEYSDNTKIKTGKYDTPAPTYKGLKKEYRFTNNVEYKFWFCPNDIKRCVSGNKKKFVLD